MVCEANENGLHNHIHRVCVTECWRERATTKCIDGKREDIVYVWDGRSNSYDWIGAINWNCCTVQCTHTLRSIRLSRMINARKSISHTELPVFLSDYVHTHRQIPVAHQSNGTYHSKIHAQCSLLTLAHINTHVHLYSPWHTRASPSTHKFTTIVLRCSQSFRFFFVWMSIFIDLIISNEICNFDSIFDHQPIIFLAFERKYFDILFNIDWHFWQFFTTPIVKCCTLDAITFNKFMSVCIVWRR